MNLNGNNHAKLNFRLGHVKDSFIISLAQCKSCLRMREDYRYHPTNNLPFMKNAKDIITMET